MHCNAFSSRSISGSGAFWDAFLLLRLGPVLDLPPVLGVFGPAARTGRPSAIFFLDFVLGVDVLLLLLPVPRPVDAGTTPVRRLGVVDRLMDVFVDPVDRDLLIERRPVDVLLVLRFVELGREFGRDEFRDSGRELRAVRAVAPRDEALEAPREEGRDVAREAGREPRREAGREEDLEAGLEERRDPALDAALDAPLEAGRELPRDPRDIARTRGVDGLEPFLRALARTEATGFFLVERERLLRFGVLAAVLGVKNARPET